jgi:hypothetical protein
VLTLLAATEAELEKVKVSVEGLRGRLRGADAREIGERAGQISNKYKVAKHFTLLISDGAFAYQRKTDQINSGAALDGLYAIRTTSRRHARRTRCSPRLRTAQNGRTPRLTTPHPTGGPRPRTTRPSNPPVAKANQSAAPKSGAWLSIARGGPTIHRDGSNDTPTADPAGRRAAGGADSLSDPLADAQGVELSASAAKPRPTRVRSWRRRPTARRRGRSPAAARGAPTSTTPRYPCAEAGRTPVATSPPRPAPGTIVTRGSTISMNLKRGLAQPNPTLARPRDPRELLDRPYGHVVDAVAGKRQAHRGARDVDDPSVVREPLGGELAAEHGALDVDVEHRVDLLLGRLCNWCERSDRGVVDEDLDVAEGGDRAVEQAARTRRGG